MEVFMKLQRGKVDNGETGGEYEDNNTFDVLRVISEMYY